MIDMNELKPILEPLLSEREDSADIIESIQGIDREPEAPDFSAREAEINKSWNDRFMKAFFGEKGVDLDTEIPQGDVGDDAVDQSADPEEISISDILLEEKGE